MSGKALIQTSSPPHWLVLVISYTLMGFKYVSFREHFLGGFLFQNRRLATAFLFHVCLVFPVKTSPRSLSQAGRPAYPSLCAVTAPSPPGSSPSCSRELPDSPSLCVMPHFRLGQQCLLGFRGDRSPVHGLSGGFGTAMASGPGSILAVVLLNYFLVSLPVFWLPGLCFPHRVPACWPSW